MTSDVRGVSCLSPRSLGVGAKKAPAPFLFPWFRGVVGSWPYETSRIHLQGLIAAPAPFGSKWVAERFADSVAASPVSGYPVEGEAG